MQVNGEMNSHVHGWTEVQRIDLLKQQCENRSYNLMKFGHKIINNIINKQ